MYESYFSLSGNPFSQEPDDNFLFLSKRHKVALAHLNYAVSNSGSLVVLTGELGAGKTTLCYKMVSDLQRQISAVIIDCKNLDEHELLKIICDQFSIKHSQGASSKDLFSDIKSHFKKSFDNDNSFLICFDEAQLLSLDVLERINLLTSINTKQQEVLSIVLVGQPRLNDILAKKNLKSLSKKINSRFNLGPLRKNEIQSYIYSRLAAAGGKEKIFSIEALQELYLCSNGNPGKINLIANRALETTFSKGESIVNAETVSAVTNEMFARSFNNIGSYELHDEGSSFRSKTPAAQAIKNLFFRWRWWLAGFSLLFLNVFLWQVYSDSNQQFIIDRDIQSVTQQKNRTQSNRVGRDIAINQTVAPSETAEDLKTVDQLLQEIEDEELIDESEVNNASNFIDQELSDLRSLENEQQLNDAFETRQLQDQGKLISLNRMLENSPQRSSFSDALKVLAGVWKATLPNGSDKQNCEQIFSSGLQCLAFSRWNKIYSYNRPAIITIKFNQSLHRVVVTSLDNGEASILFNRKMYKVSEKQLRSMWVTPGIILWRPDSMISNKLFAQGDISQDLTEVRQAISKVEAKIGSTAETNINQPMLFDKRLTRRIANLQDHFALQANGLMNYETYILLNEVLKPDGRPVLNQRL